MRLSGVLLTTAPPGLTRAGRLNQSDFGYEVSAQKTDNSNCFSKKDSRGVNKCLKMCLSKSWMVPWGTSINDVSRFLAISDLPTYLVLLYNVPF